MTNRIDWAESWWVEDLLNGYVGGQLVFTITVFKHRRHRLTAYVGTEKFWNFDKLEDAQDKAEDILNVWADKCGLCFKEDQK